MGHMEENKREEAAEALKSLLWELPAEFSTDPDEEDSSETREFFTVVKRSNVRKIHRALWTLQEYFLSDE